VLQAEFVDLLPDWIFMRVMRKVLEGNMEKRRAEALKRQGKSD
jgi:hypothetical protein